MSLREIIEHWATECDLELTNGEASFLIKLMCDNFKLPTIEECITAYNSGQGRCFLTEEDICIVKWFYGYIRQRLMTDV